MLVLKSRRASAFTARNLIRNTEMIGAVAGTPGTPPRGWGTYNPSGGPTMQIVGVSDESGLKRIDWRFSGTPSVSAGSTITFATGIAGGYPLRDQYGRNFALSAYVKVVANPSPPSAIDFQVTEFDLAGTYLGYEHKLITPTMASLISQRQKLTGKLTQPNVALAVPLIAIYYNASTAIDVTIGIALPQYEHGVIVTAPQHRNNC